jgi:hypothetical protein
MGRRALDAPLIHSWNATLTTAIAGVQTSGIARNLTIISCTFRCSDFFFGGPANEVSL